MQSLRSKDRKPTHPGEIIREDVLPAMGITQEAFAQMLGVSRRTVSEIIHERRTVTVDMAIRLGRLFGHTPESWLNMQREVDVWELERVNGVQYSKIRKFKQAKVS